MRTYKQDVLRLTKAVLPIALTPKPQVQGRLQEESKLATVRVRHGATDWQVLHVLVNCTKQRWNGCELSATALELRTYAELLSPLQTCALMISNPSHQHGS